MEGNLQLCESYVGLFNMEKIEGGSLYKNQGEIYRASLNVNHTLWIVTRKE